MIGGAFGSVIQIRACSSMGTNGFMTNSAVRREPGERVHGEDHRGAEKKIREMTLQIGAVSRKRT